MHEVDKDLVLVFFLGDGVSLIETDIILRPLAGKEAVDESYDKLLREHVTLEDGSPLDPS